MPLLFTTEMEKRLTRRVLRMLETSLGEFPELCGKTITVGVTRANLGSAVVTHTADFQLKLTIRLNVRKLSYHTIGHELTHLAQALARLGKELHRGLHGHVPTGEKQCDIWTLARSPLFCDEPPTYLRLPKTTKENWSRHARATRALCIAAIEKRKTDRFYIRWLESEIRASMRLQGAAEAKNDQLSLPFEA